MLPLAARKLKSCRYLEHVTITNTLIFLVKMFEFNIVHDLMSCFRSRGIFFFFFFFEESKRLLHFVLGMYGEDENGCW